MHEDWGQGCDMDVVQAPQHHAPLYCFRICRQQQMGRLATIGQQLESASAPLAFCSLWLISFPDDKVGASHYLNV